MDSETGLYYFGARYYDPRTSVWVSADPILADSLDPRQSRRALNSRTLSAYMYVSGNPLLLVDPDGNREMTPREQEFAKTFFGKAIDYRVVDIQPTSWDSPHVSGNTIYLPDVMAGSKNDKDQATVGVGGDFRSKFLHELEHVRQNQKGEFVTFKAGAMHTLGFIKGVLKALFMTPFSDKNFGQIVNETRENFVYSYKDLETKSHSEYSVEQRGQIVEDFANSKFKGGNDLTDAQKKAQEIIKADPGALEK